MLLSFRYELEGLRLQQHFISILCSDVQQRNVSQELTKQWEKLRNRNENAGPLRKQLAADTLAKVASLPCCHLRPPITLAMHVLSMLFLLSVLHAATCIRSAAILSSPHNWRLMPIRALGRLPCSLKLDVCVSTQSITRGT